LKLDRLWRWLPFAIVACIFALELRVDVMDVDSAQYAHLSRQMFETKSFLIIKNRWWDYLDKPPLTFWLACLSYAIFGVSTAAYKLPSVLFALLGIASTYNVARLYYNERIAYLAALVLSTTVAMFLWTNDVRTDAILLGSVMFCVWQLAEYRRSGKWRHFVGGFIGMGLALLSKGPVGAMVPVLAIGTDAVLKRDWRWLVSPRWLLGALLSLAMLVPMLIGLYQQYGTRGIKFYFWTQSFGRITGENVWRDSTTPLFFTHTILWEMLPWTVLFLAGLFHALRDLVRVRFRLNANEEAIAIGGLVLPFVALSLSHYKLPHYIFVLLPLASVITAKELVRLAERGSRLTRFVTATQLVLVVVLWTIAAWLCVVAFPVRNVAVWSVLVAGFLLAIWTALPRQPSLIRLAGPPLATITAFAFMLAVHFFPAVMRYQASTQAAHKLNELGIPREQIYAYRTTPYSFDFEIRSLANSLELDHVRDGWVLTDTQGRRQIEDAGLRAEVVGEYENFPVTKLSLLFLRPETRASRLERYYLLHVRRL
jgi:4-amino-4-deoxy-L-arabinose transferase-like glycosyltransferase